MIRGTCPVCGRFFRVDDRYAGATGRCKVCGATVKVPGEPYEGLDALPPLRDQEVPEPRPSPPEQPAAPAPAEPERPAADQARVPGPGAPAGPPPQGAPSEQEAPSRAAGSPEEPRSFDDSTHDARARYEPPHGPTTLEGSWLKDEEAAAGSARREPQSPEPSRADQALATSKIVTTVEPEGPARRPAVLVVACVLLGLLGACFFVHFVTAELFGAAAAAIGAVLAGMGILRLWAGYWDGMVPALLFCLCVAGGALAMPEARFGPGAMAFVAGAGVVLFFLGLTVLLPSSREYLSS